MKKITADPNRCPQNHRCPAMRICPVGAISQEGFTLPVVNKSTCISCGKCKRYCPMQAFDEVN
jgi:Fe-S-cluster-containing hydrogenase component 2